MTSSDPRDNERTDFDARFAEIVAQFEDEPLESSTLEESPEPPAEPSAEFADAESTDVESADVEAEPPPPPPADPIGQLPSQWRMPSSDGASALLDDDGTYEPPPPAPLPAGDLQFWGILAGLIGGPLWLLYLFFLDRDARPLWWVLACGVTVAGLVMLIMRQPINNDDTDEYDDGAVV